MSEHSSSKVVILGMGGTIAGLSAVAGDHVGYQAGLVGIDDLLATAGLQASSLNLVSEQICQIDSKDMSFELMHALQTRVRHHLMQADVCGVVVTHGTDTLEETAYFLHACVPTSLQGNKPVVLTCAMRPANAVSPDGPQNLADAILVASSKEAKGVVTVVAGVIHGAPDVQKIHPYRVDAFSSGPNGPVGFVEDGAIRLARPWPVHLTEASEVVVPSNSGDGSGGGGDGSWPWVEIVTSTAGTSGAGVAALVQAGVAGLVVAATGNGTVHQQLASALQAARARGVKVVVSTRCKEGQVVGPSHIEGAQVSALSPVKARVALCLALRSDMPACQ
ncbi:MAG: hypothetical protein RL459_1585 [Pseudomonadota bacterium]|jgi:L-asparaginase